MKCTRLTIIILLFTVLLPCSALAHPHVFIDASVTLKIDDNGLAGTRNHWVFDDMFTSALLSDLNIAPESLKTAQGQKAIKTGGFDNLKSVNYFTTVFRNKKPFPVKGASDFKAYITEDNRLVYDFFLNIGVPAADVTDMRVAVYDPSYYADILLVEEDLAVEVDGAMAASHTVVPANDLAYWGGFVIPKAIKLTLSPSVPGAPPLAQAGKKNAPIESMMANRPQPVQEAVQGPGLLQSIMIEVVAWQKELKKTMTSLGNEIRSNPLGKAFWLFLLLSFIYGMVHAVGPGHGKTVVCSYFLARPGSIFKGAVMGNAITIVHVSSAAAVVGIASLIFGSGMGGFQQAARYIQPASYALLLAVGLGLAIKIILDMRKGGLLKEASCPETSDEAVEKAARSGDMKSILLVSFATGMIPCPGAAVILAFTLGLNIALTGVASMLAMALGMGLTTTLFAWAAISARGATLTVSSRNRTLFNWLYGTLSVGSALCIAAFGLAMLVGSVGMSGSLG